MAEEEERRLSEEAEEKQRLQREEEEAELERKAQRKAGQSHTSHVSHSERERERYIYDTLLIHMVTYTYIYMHTIGSLWHKLKKNTPNTPEWLSKVNVKVPKVNMRDNWSSLTTKLRDQVNRGNPTGTTSETGGKNTKENVPPSIDDVDSDSSSEESEGSEDSRHRQDRKGGNSPALNGGSLGLTGVLNRPHPKLTEGSENQHVDVGSGSSSEEEERISDPRKRLASMAARRRQLISTRDTSFDTDQPAVTSSTRRPSHLGGGFGQGGLGSLGGGLGSAALNLEESYEF